MTIQSKSDRDRVRQRAAMAAKTKQSRKIRARGRPGTIGPGCEPNVEDKISGSASTVFRLRPEAPKAPGPKVRGRTSLSRKEVWEKLETAMKTLRALPDRERRFFAVKSGFPDFVRDYMDAYASVEAVAPRYQPSPQDISEYLTVLSWSRHLDRREWQILWWRSFGISYGVIGKYIGRSDEAARRRFENALTDVWTAAVGV